jgi:valyl-tRNA synthetase
MPDQEALAPRYDPKTVEGRWYGAWLAAGAFRAPADSPKKPFVIVIPPPNVTGSLHMGHALNNTLQDTLIRWKRMQGFNACWVPGTDHASISTTVMVERQLKEQEGKSRHDVGREEFLRRVEAWREVHGNRIIEQLKVIGSSCDWDRLRYTMDEPLSRAVTRHFVDCHRDGLIYRGERIVNWCPRCQTALSDLEVKRQERKGSLWHIRYPLKDGGAVVVATTRPETMLGDTAVAVHPEDARHLATAGRTAILPLVNREIPVIADAYVDKAFGTGAVKITPGHDPADFEIGKRHLLPTISLLNLDATLNAAAGPYAGMDRFKAREKIVADLDAAGLLVQVEPHTSAVGLCERCATVLEPIISKQWYMTMRGLADEAVKVVERGERDPHDPGGVRLLPANQPAIFHEWMRNIQDWCISRQLWFGHRIPAYHCAACAEITVAETAPATCPQCGGAVTQDPDTLDTWFSSCLWPFSVFGWPDPAEMKRLGFEKFYPGDVLVTGSDIIFFWVARMIMMGLKHTGTIPFRTVVFNSIITDPEGKKMSKTKGNVVDPLELFDQFGTDAVRFALASQESLKQSFRLTPDRVEHARNFMNKIWNATRFALGELDGYAPSATPPAGRTVADRWIVTRAHAVAAEATRHLDQFEFNAYAGLLEEFFWHELCDVYLELAKPELKAGGERRAAAQWTLATVLEIAMRLLHPVVPFISEEIWQRLPRPAGQAAFIMLAEWPHGGAGDDPQAAALMGDALAITAGLRSLKHESGLATGDAAAGAARPADAAAGTRLAELVRLGYLATLSRTTVTPLDAVATAPAPSVSTIIPGYTVYLALPQAADPAAERARFTKERDDLTGLLQRAKATLANAAYIAKAPPAVVEETRRKAADYEVRLVRLAERLGQL